MKPLSMGLEPATCVGSPHHKSVRHLIALTRVEGSDSKFLCFSNNPFFQIVLLDVKACGYIFNPINDELICIRYFPENAKIILWDNSITDKDIFIVLDQDNVLHTYIVNPDDVEEGGTSVSCLGQTKGKFFKSQTFPFRPHLNFPPKTSYQVD